MSDIDYLYELRVRCGKDEYDNAEDDILKQFITEAMNNVMIYTNRTSIPITLQPTVLSISHNLYMNSFAKIDEEAMAFAMSIGDTSLTPSRKRESLSTAEIMHNYKFILTSYRKVLL